MFKLIVNFEVFILLAVVYYSRRIITTRFTESFQEDMMISIEAFWILDKNLSWIWFLTLLWRFFFVTVCKRTYIRSLMYFNCRRWDQRHSSFASIFMWKIHNGIVMSIASISERKRGILTAGRGINLNWMSRLVNNIVLQRIWKAIINPCLNSNT